MNFSASCITWSGSWFIVIDRTYCHLSCGLSNEANFVGGLGLSETLEHVRISFFLKGLFLSNPRVAKLHNITVSTVYTWRSAVLCFSQESSRVWRLTACMKGWLRACISRKSLLSANCQTKQWPSAFSLYIPSQCLPPPSPILRLVFS